jgi:lipopolysaccharide/colanic/teichoic acid biosynthesis glycosyltransferase
MAAAGARAHLVGRGVGDKWAKRALDVTCSAVLLLVLIPLFAVIAVAIKLDSSGPVFYRCRRVGYRGRVFGMLKFRKMFDGVSGPPLTIAGDARLTRIGTFLAASKLDELPQLWNVLIGEMSLVGPRPEDPEIVVLRAEEFAPVLETLPGMTGLCQLEYADESSLLDPGDRIAHYLDVLLPQKLELDGLYALRRTIWLDLRILAWTAVTVPLRLRVVVDRTTCAVVPCREQLAPDLLPPSLDLEPVAEIAA